MTLRWAPFLAGLLAACAAPAPPFPSSVDPAIKAEIEQAAEAKRQPPPPPPTQALLPPLRMEMPEASGRPIDPRFDLSVSNAPASQVFMAIVSGTRYSMLLHPGVSGNVSVNLKDVTIHEALDSLRELYGYDYKFEGTRIFVQPAGLQSRIYKVNYLLGLRRGTSDVRVQSGSLADTNASGTPPVPASAATPIPGTLPGSAQLGGGPSRSLDSSRVTTQVVNDFWTELRTALTAIVGAGDGRSVVVTPQSGIVVVRALPSELRAVEHYLRATRMVIERQVMLEAKIVEVTLSEAYQAGINWAAFRNTSPNLAVGQLSTGLGTTTLGATGSPPQPLQGGGQTVNTAERVITAAGSALAATNPASAVFGIALQTSNFAALLQFLESQGAVQVLSSPRIATLNNQKAVLKVGTDEFFVTNVATVTTTTGTSTQQTPTVTVAPFFSGILLDVTPQIDGDGNITLHIHPSISEVTESQRVVNLGGTVPSITLPLARSAVNETDTIVRVGAGNIVAIGGLMSVDVRDNRGGLPGLGDVAPSLRNVNRVTRKRELVILIKPTILDNDRAWDSDARQTRQRFETLYPPAGADTGERR